MNNKRLQTIEQVKQFLAGSEALDFVVYVNQDCSEGTHYYSEFIVVCVRAC